MFQFVHSDQNPIVGGICAWCKQLWYVWIPQRTTFR